MTTDAVPAATRLAGMLRGLRLRCPYCGRGRLIRGWMTLATGCDECGADFTLRPGDFAGAVMIAQYLVGILTLPLLVILLLATDWPLTTLLVAIFGSVITGILVFYRNIKGIWFGFLLTEESRQRRAAAA